MALTPLSIGRTKVRAEGAVVSMVRVNVPEVGTVDGSVLLFVNQIVYDPPESDEPGVIVVVALVWLAERLVAFPNATMPVPVEYQA